MKYLFTRCPTCGLRFYVEGASETELDIICSRCNTRYSDRTDRGFIKEADYSWELYGGIYPNSDRRLGDRRQMDICSSLLITTLIFYLVPIVYAFIYVMGSDVRNPSAISGFALAATMYTVVIVAGTYSCLRRYSFALSFSGAVFGVLNFFLVSMILIEMDLSWAYCFLMFIPVISSFVAISLILKNKRIFSLGI